MTSPSVLSVQLHGTDIGHLSFLEGDRTLFTFTQDYIEDEQRPTLGLRFKDALGDLITEFRPYRIRLMPFFSNLLPEGALRQYLAERARVHADREFFLLAALGADLPGAITVSAEEPSLPRPSGQDCRAEDASTSSTDHRILHFSLAGVQLKFSAMQSARYGLTIPANGVGGDWIVKLPAREFTHVPENEFSMMLLARRVGINVPEVNLIDVANIGNLPGGLHHHDQKALAIKRFDRNAQGGAIHMEDFAQVFDVYAEDKYKKASLRTIATVLAAESGLLDIAELIRRMTFNVLIGNGDMHLKNWSLVYPDKRHPRLSPAYDLVSTIAYIPNDKFALKFSRSRNFEDYTWAELAHLADKVAIPAKLVLDTAKETVALFMQHWEQEKRHLPAASDVLNTIDKHLQTLAIL